MARRELNARISQFHTPNLAQDSSKGPAAPTGKEAGGAVFEAAEELALADKIFSKEKFGEIDGRQVWPFSRQLKTDIEGHFSIDSDTFKETNKLQSRIWFLYVFLRLLTLSTFVGWLYVFVSVIFVHLEISSRPEMPAFFSAGTRWVVSAVAALVAFFSEVGVDPGRSILLLLLIVGSTIILGAIRLLLRLGYFGWVGNIVDKWATQVILDHANIVNRITDCCNKILIRPQEGPKLWPAVAKNWAKVALFNAKRVEYLDRHSTTTLWKIDRNLFEIELFFRIVKIILGIAVLLVIWAYAGFATMKSLEVWEKIVLTAIIFFGSIGVWDRMHRQSNDLWREKLVDLFNRKKVQKTHYFDQIGDVIRAVVASLIAQDQNQGGLSAGERFHVG